MVLFVQKHPRPNGQSWRKALLAAGGVMIAGAALLWGCSDSSSVAPSGLPGSPATRAQILQGRYLVTAVAGCGDCHSPTGSSPSNPNWLSGYIQSPTLNPGDNGKFQVGPDTVYAANITPDVATGIGSWTPQQIFNALRLGHDKAGNVLCPPMPWPAFRNMTDADTWSIVAYLQSIKPVTNAVPEATGPGVPAGQHPDCSIFYTNLQPLPAYPAGNETSAAR